MIKIKNWKLHLIMSVMLVVFALLALASTASSPDSNTSATSNSTNQNQQQSSQKWTGTGGRGTSIAILTPRAIGLLENQSHLPALVQGEFVSNFSNFSAISVLDRQRLDEQHGELLSGFYAVSRLRDTIWK